MDDLVSTEWLAAELGAGDLCVLDASWHLPDTHRDAAAEFEQSHIPGAVFLDLGELVDPDSPLDNTLPDEVHFASRMQSLGIGNGSRIVVYDDSAVKSAARAWFMLRLFGCHDVAVLDGGLGKWKAEGRDLATGRETLRHRHFTPRADHGRLRSKAQVLSNVSSGTEQVVDARGPARFAGSDPEPRPGVSPGHIPGACNVPYAALFNPDGTYKPADQLRPVFEKAGIDLARPVISTCGSGITACVLIFALHLLGKDDVALYDGSWADWGTDPDTPKALGAA